LISACLLSACTTTVHTTYPGDLRMWDGIFARAEPFHFDVKPIAAVAPHHLIDAHELAGFWAELIRTTTPSTLVVIGPDHFLKGGGLSLGADDYLTKPFSPAELVLRVSAILRRTGSTAPVNADTLVIGPLHVNRAAMSVTVDGMDVELTPTEFKLLLTLVDRRGRVQARGLLLETVWDAAPDIQTRTVDMHVQRLRAKLGAAGDMIETVRGFGYRFRAAMPRRG
jgi:DNA-binding response OmpR family regulator